MEDRSRDLVHSAQQIPERRRPSLHLPAALLLLAFLRHVSPGLVVVLFFVGAGLSIFSAGAP